MKRRRAIFRRWQDLGITGKFTSAFGHLLLLMALTSTVSVAALVAIRRQIETTIFTSVEIQRLVLEMDAHLHEARRLEKDFFWRYPTIGYSVAYQTYAVPAAAKVQYIRGLSTDLQQFVSESNTNSAWHQHVADLNLYLSAVDRHATTVEQAAALVAQLADAETGLQVQLAEQLHLLGESLEIADNAGLMVLYGEMRAFGQDYMLARQRPLMQSAFNVAVPLRTGIESGVTLEPQLQAQTLAYLDRYLAVASQILELDVAIRSKFDTFDLEAEAVDPVAAELVALAEHEVEIAWHKLRQINRITLWSVILSTLIGLVLVIVIARLLNNNVTRDIVALTHVAGELQEGRLQVRARINSTDELGQLASSFNSMAARIDNLVGNLEREVALRTEALHQEKDFAETVIDTAPAVVLILDTEGRVVRINAYLEELTGYRMAEVQRKGLVQYLRATTGPCRSAGAFPAGH